jgi:hypothetical protein
VLNLLDFFRLTLARFIAHRRAASQRSCSRVSTSKRSDSQLSGFPRVEEILYRKTGWRERERPEKKNLTKASHRASEERGAKKKATVVGLRVWSGEWEGGRRPRAMSAWENFYRSGMFICQNES